MIVITNNSVIDIPLTNHGKETVTTFVAPSSNESLLESTNNPFSKITEIVSYSWEKKDANCNLIAVHRSKPLIAYVINTGYHKNFSTGRHHLQSNPLDQVIRLVNYDTSSRALCKPMMRSSIVDIAFSFDTTEQETNKVAIIDMEASIAILEYKELPQGLGVDKGAIRFEKVLTVLPPTGSPGLSPFLKLSWCPYIPGDEDDDDGSAALRLAVAIGRSVEIFTFAPGHFKPETVPLDRSHFRKDLGQYLALENLHESPIVSIAMSNDGTAICSGSSDNTMVFNQITYIGSSLSPSSGIGEPEVKQLKSWGPKWESGEESLSAFFFLDDYEYLLNHPDQSFWGHVFIGSKNGVMKIFDLKDPKWKCIQTVKIDTKWPQVSSTNLMDTDDTNEESFSYHVDSSSKVILAIRKNLVFVLLVEVSNRTHQHHHRGSSVTEASDDDNVLVPRIRQVARFQLYNPVISFRVKKTTPQEVDIFWMTLKTLQKCTIYTDKLDRLKEMNPTMVQAIMSNPQSMSNPGQSVPTKAVAPTVIPQSSFGGLFASSAGGQVFGSANQPSSVFGSAAQPPSDFVSAGQPTRAFIQSAFPSTNDLMANIQASAASTSSPAGQQSSSALDKLLNFAKRQPAVPSNVSNANVSNVNVSNDQEAELMRKLQAKDEELKKRKSDAGHGVNYGEASSASASSSGLQATSTPSKLNNQLTTELTNKLNIKPSGSASKVSAGNQRPLPVGTQVVNPTNLGVPMINPPLGLPTSLNDTARAMLLDDRFRDLERSFNQQFNSLNSKLSTAFTGLQTEVASLRSTIEVTSSGSSSKVDRSLLQATIDKTVEKSMKQLNTIVSSGLKEFFDQVDLGMTELQQSVTKSINDVQSMYSQTNQQMAQLQRQLEIFQTQLEKNEAEQQLLLYRFQQVTSNVSNVSSPTSSQSTSTLGNLGNLFR